MPHDSSAALPRRPLQSPGSQPPPPIAAQPSGRGRARAGRAASGWRPLAATGPWPRWRRLRRLTWRQVGGACPGAAAVPLAAAAPLCLQAALFCACRHREARCALRQGPAVWRPTWTDPPPRLHPAPADEDDSGGAGAAAPPAQQQQQGAGPAAAGQQQQQQQQGLGQPPGQQPSYMLDAVEEDPDRELHLFEVEPAKVRLFGAGRGCSHPASVCRARRMS